MNLHGEKNSETPKLLRKLEKGDPNKRKKLHITNYAKMWTTKTTKAMLFDQLETDEHSPNYLRVNSILSTTDAFYETYGVKEGDGMYVAPDKRISRWH